VDYPLKKGAPLSNVQVKYRCVLCKQHFSTEEVVIMQPGYPLCIKEFKILVADGYLSADDVHNPNEPQQLGIW